MNCKTPDYPVFRREITLHRFAEFETAKLQDLTVRTAKQLFCGAEIWVLPF